MSTHRVIVELPVEAYEQLRHLVAEGGYASESDAISDALRYHLSPGDLLETNSLSGLKPELSEEFCAAYDEDLVNPEAALLPSELDAYLARERMHLRKAG